MEIWKPIVGYECLYEISNFGRVRSFKHKNEWRILQSRKNNRGYQMIFLCKDGRRSVHLLHRLVATYFCEKPDGCNVVNHIDNNPENNRADNLEWVTQKENVLHAKQFKRHKGDER